MPILRKTINLAVSGNTLLPTDSVTALPTTDAGIQGENEAVMLHVAVPTDWQGLTVRLQIISESGSYDESLDAVANVIDMPIRQGVAIPGRLSVSLIGLELIEIGSYAIRKTADCKSLVIQSSKLPINAISLIYPQAFEVLRSEVQTKTIHTITGSGGALVTRVNSQTVNINVTGTGGDMLQANYANGNVNNINSADVSKAAQSAQVGSPLDTSINLKANQTDVNTQIAAVASSSPKAVYSTLAALQAAFPAGNTGIYVIAGNVYEVDTLNVTAATTLSSNVTVTLNGVAKTVAVASGDTTSAVATKIRAAIYTGWATGGTGTNVTFTNLVSGAVIPSVFSAGTTGSAATFTVTTTGTNYGSWYYWNGSAWTAGGTYQSTGISDLSVTPVKTSFASIDDYTNAAGDFVPVNAFNTSDLRLDTVGSYLNPANGSVATTAYTTNYLYSNYVAVLPSTIYVRKLIYGACGSILFYTSANVFISGAESSATVTLNGKTGGKFTTPSNCAYIRYNSFVDSQTNDYIYQVQPAIGSRAVVIPNLNIASSTQQGIINYVNLDTSFPLLKKLAGKTMVCFGDSVIGNFSPPTDVPTYINKVTGLTTVNMGFGGCTMGNHLNANFLPFSMCNLIDAIVSGNYAPQDAITTEVPTYFALTRLPALKAINFNTVDYISLSYGTNDWGNISPVDDVGNLLNKNRYPGAVRYICSKLWSLYPKIKVLLTTPIYRFGLDTGHDKDSDTYQLGGYYLDDFGAALKVIGKELKTPVLDAYNELGFNKYTRNYYFDSATDQTHPNANGRSLFGSKIAGTMLSKF